MVTARKRLERLANAKGPQKSSRLEGGILEEESALREFRGSRSNIDKLGVCKMGDLTFLGIENPLGVLGPKTNQGVLVDKTGLDPIKHVSKDTPDASR